MIRMCCFRFKPFDHDDRFIIISVYILQVEYVLVFFIDEGNIITLVGLDLTNFEWRII